MIRTIAIFIIWGVLLGVAPLIAVGLLLGWVIFNAGAFR
jgi:hypothetical protein